jgi:putative ABC transport system permease protein
MSTVIRDLRLATRTLLARPGLSLVRVITLAVVIGAASAVLLVVNATLIRPLPFGTPERLVRLYLQPPGTTSFTQANPLHPQVFVGYREQVPASLEAIEGIWARDRSVTGNGEPDNVPAAAVSPGLFTLLGATPMLGRVFTDDEAREARRVVVIGHGFWSRRFGRNATAIGNTLVIDRESYEVIGVMPASFNAVFVRSEFWTPLEVRAGNLINPGASFIQTVARLRPGASLEETQAALQAVLTSVARDDNTARLKGWQAGVRDLRDAQYGRQTRPLLLLLASVLALSLIAAANLGNLTLADVLHRRGELAIRSALGASRAALLWPEVVQSLLIAAAGGVLGLGAALLALPAIVRLDPANLITPDAFAVDWRVVIAVSVLSFAVISTAAILPARRIAGADVAAALAEGGRRSAGGRSQERLRGWLVATQTALAMMLISTGALLAAAFERTAGGDPGFRAENVLTAQLRLAESAYATPQSRVAFVDTVLTRVRGIPGVIDASTTLNLFVPGFTFKTLVHIEAHPRPDGQLHTVLFRRISPGYFSTLRIRELAGRTFDSRDTPTSMPAAVVSRLFANRFWPGEDAIGQRIRRGVGNAWLTVIGIVDDVQDLGYGQPADAIIYIPFAQNNVVTAPISLVVRTSGDPLTFVPAVKAQIWEVDPAQPLASVGTLEQFLKDSLGPQRFRSVLLGIFSGVGLLLAAIGIYAVTSRTVAERTREAGVRLALGGRPARVWWTVAGRSLRAFAIGVLAGSIGAIAAAGILASLFPEVEATSRLYAVPALALLLCAGVGTALAAAHRVTRLDPLKALRTD